MAVATTRRAPAERVRAASPGAAALERRAAEAGVDVACDDGVFPSFDVACDGEADCAIVLHQADCCGSRVALGVRSDQVHTFDIAEAVCVSQYPECGCAAQPTTAEDGQTAASEDLIEVTCDAGSCTTFVP
jgi:hypothetical protein